MKIKYMGKFNGNEDSLPSRPHRNGYVPFKEFQDMKKFAILINVIGCLITLLLFVVNYFIFNISLHDNYYEFLFGYIVATLLLLPHEYLHGICFKEECYVFTNLKQGMLFVVGFEDMTKSRFVFLSIFPTLIFGFIPYIIGIILQNPFLLILGSVGIGSGVGDYYNIMNCLLQVPKGGLVYMYGLHSYWYIPQKATNN